MANAAEFEIIYEGNVNEFEEQILYNTEQEFRKGIIGPWSKLADIYARQITIISYNPYPDETIGTEWSNNEETLPSIKQLNKNTIYNNFYRWGIYGGNTGNHRIIYAIHNYSKVIMLYHFDKQYNGAIKRDDLLFAEINYENFTIHDPNFY